MFMVVFDTKHRITDISGFTRDHSDSFLHCFGIFYVNAQVSKYKLADIFRYSVAEVIFLGCLKISWTYPPYAYVLSAPWA